MQIVPKWNRSVRPGGLWGSTGHAVDRVVPVSASRAMGGDDKTPDHSLRPAWTAPGLGFGGHALIATQVVVSRTFENIDPGFDASTLLAGNSAYGAALERKVHRLAGGNFYRDQA
ncbi:MAG: hypothetical protein H2045_06880 [Rhizobiales bacterium]|nr:hypothetical protein [Hyphomicrobiales bacterium]